MPFCHLTLKCRKPQNCSYLWKASLYPTTPTHIGKHIKKRRFDLKLKATECQKLLGVDKSTLTNWENGKHRPSRQAHAGIVRFLGYDPAATKWVMGR
jgi:DNA-binding transcriptional regulator YiaG